MVFVIGDIHGELNKLRLLLSKIKKLDKDPTCIFVGDYVDKGSDSFGVLKELISFKKENHCLFLWGNHDFQWWNLPNKNSIQNYLSKYGGVDTMKSLGASNILEAREILIDNFGGFFQKFKKYTFVDNYFISHSGINPKFINEEHLWNISINHFLFNREEFINLKSLYKGKYKTIFGHTAFEHPYVDDYKIGIDTGACYHKNRSLTAVCLDENYFVYSNNNILQPIDDLKNKNPKIIR